MDPLPNIRLLTHKCPCFLRHLVFLLLDNHHSIHHCMSRIMHSIHSWIRSTVGRVIPVYFIPSSTSVISAYVGIVFSTK